MKIVTIWNTYSSYHLARVKALECASIDANVICFSHCTEQDDYNFFNLQPKQHKVLVKKNASQLKSFESLIATLKALWTEQPDLILTCGYERPETLASVIWSRISNKTVFLMMDNQYADRPRYELKEFVKKCYLKFFDGFICGGNSHKDYLHKLGAPTHRIKSGYDCVDNDAIWQEVVATRKSRRSLAESSNYFLCVSRMIPKKNLIRLIKAHTCYADRLSQETIPWSLLICGDGPERKQIENTIHNCGATNRVVLLGQVDQFAQIINYYAFAKALVLASHENEQWGLVVNEAMASGLPVLVSRQSGCASHLVQEGENGFTFDAMSIEQLTTHFLWLHQNAEQLPKMGERSREIIQHYSTDNFAINVMALYASFQKASI